jgi:ABC-type transport system involved in cytochrome c biogenesis permease subunit
MKKLRQHPIVKIAASLKLTVICLLILIVLTVWGTIFQAEHGLYAAQQKFFHSWVFLLLGFIPFPGTVLTMAVLFINLCFALIFRVGYRWSNIGNILTHLGIIILLVGGFYTFNYSEESVLSLQEGESSRFTSSNYDWEFAVWQEAGGKRKTFAVDSNGFSSNREVSFEPLNLKIKINDYFPNSEIITQQGNPGMLSAGHGPINASGIKALKKLPSSPEPVQDQAGIIFDIVSPAMSRPILLYGGDNTPTSVSIDGKTYGFSLRKKRFQLPVSIQLLDFKKVMYPGSEIPKSYESLVMVKTEGLEREVQISMNKPLRFKDITMFQSSYFIDRNGTEYSILAVVKNAGRLMPYISSLLIFLGIGIHFFIMLFRRKKTLTAVILAVLGASLMYGAPPASGDLSLDELQKVVILENGRKKPLDTYAQNILKQLSGRSKYQRTPAIQWLAKILFTPLESVDDQVFLINHPDVLNAIGMTPTGRDRGRYSYKQLQSHIAQLRQLAFKASKIDDNARTMVETELIILYNKLYMFQQLTGSFDFAFENEDFTLRSDTAKDLLGLDKSRDTYSYYELAAKKNTILEAAAADEEALALSKNIEQWSRYFVDSPLAIIHDAGAPSEQWQSPKALLSSFVAHGTTPGKRLDSLVAAARAYRAGDQAAFDNNLQEFNKLIAFTIEKEMRENAIGRELLYNKVDPFYKSEFFYGFSFLLLMISFIVFKKWLYRISVALLAAGLVYHTFGLILRMMITGRPPVTNLYETFVFTGWVTALLGVVLELFKRKNIGILTGSLSGLAMLLIAGKYSLDGDTMGMLMAVLDSNFWLATHVITITVGYGGIVISGVIGHLYLLQRIFQKDKRDILEKTFQAIYATQAFGLAFTFLGTVLGGIWADQSWGRFWGWDPKENGALLIVLWSAVLFHARLAKWMKEVGFALGSIVGVITVILAWFGVNLLGVGLHSYGFTSGIAATLAIFIAFECLYMLGTFIWITAKEKKTASIK